MTTEALSQSQLNSAAQTINTGIQRAVSHVVAGAQQFATATEQLVEHELDETAVEALRNAMVTLEAVGKLMGATYSNVAIALPAVESKPSAPADDEVTIEPDVTDGEPTTAPPAAG